VNDRIIKTISLALALGLHLFILYLGTRQYQAASMNPERANAAAQALMGQHGKPVKFVYVRDTTPSKEPPLDRSRVSDMQRKGASPDGGKGKSPDPTSLGNSGTREIGGMGRTGPTPRAARPPSPPGGATSPPQPATEPSEGKGARKAPTAQPDAPGAGKLALPAPGGGSPAAPRAGTQGLPPQPQGMGVGGQLQQMYMGTMQGGFNNPNASKLNSGAVSFDTAGWDLGPYARQVQERVQSNWRTPEVQEVLRQKGWVAVHFVVHKDGRITDLAVVRPSGIPSYDQSALNALKSSDPLPPLPAEVTIPQITGTFRFFYNMPIMEEEE
jgi:TonB family protein